MCLLLCLCVREKASAGTKVPGEFVAFVLGLCVNGEGRGQINDCVC